MLENHPLDSHFANKAGVASAVMELIKYGGKSLLNVKDSVYSRSALHVAALCDNDTFIDTACSQGSNVDQVSRMCLRLKARWCRQLNAYLQLDSRL